ncbi:MAG TPA: hypothetical protein VHD83_08295 [Puia sp.]|nr:hypothetical protein [Puia sp.]
MKSITRLVACAITIATVSIISCKKGDTGPAGPAGPAGPQGIQGVQGLPGPTGQDGNANVMQYVYAPTDQSGQNFTGIDLTKPAPDSNYIGLQLLVKNDTADISAWFVYMFKVVNGYGYWAAIPGPGLGDQSTYSFSYVYEDVQEPLDTCDFFIDRVTGPGEVYDAIRIVRILISNVGTNSTHGSGRLPGLPNIDFSNYEEVKKYYHLQ